MAYVDHPKQTFGRRDVTGRRNERVVRQQGGTFDPATSREGQPADSPQYPRVEEGFRTVLRVALLCFLLALPLLGMAIYADLDFNGVDICLRYDVNDTKGLGIWYQVDSEITCKFMLGRVLIYWTLSAVMVSPIAIFGTYLRRHLRRIRRLKSSKETTAKAGLWRGFFLNAGLCTLAAFALGGGAWMPSLLILPGVALAIYIFHCWRALRNHDIGY